MWHIAHMGGSKSALIVRVDKMDSRSLLSMPELRIHIREGYSIRVACEARQANDASRKLRSMRLSRSMKPAPCPKYSAPSDAVTPINLSLRLGSDAQAMLISCHSSHSPLEE